MSIAMSPVVEAMDITTDGFCFLADSSCCSSSPGLLLLLISRIVRDLVLRAAP